MRADAQRSRAAILDGALELLNEQPDASMEAIAAAAGVTRQTVYAHYPSRDDLVAALIDKLTADTVAELDGAGLDEGPAADALLRVLEIGRGLSERYPGLIGLMAAAPASPQVDRQRHAPVADRLRAIIARGQASGEFSARANTDWLVTATIALGHAAGTEAAAGRMSADHAGAELAAAVLRLVGATVR